MLQQLLQLRRLVLPSRHAHRPRCCHSSCNLRSCVTGHALLLRRHQRLDLRPHIREAPAQGGLPWVAVDRVAVPRVACTRMALPQRRLGRAPGLGVLCGAGCGRVLGGLSCGVQVLHGAPAVGGDTWQVRGRRGRRGEVGGLGCFEVGGKARKGKGQHG